MRECSTGLTGVGPLRVSDESIAAVEGLTATGGEGTAYRERDHGRLPRHQDGRHHRGDNADR